MLTGARAFALVLLAVAISNQAHADAFATYQFEYVTPFHDRGGNPVIVPFNVIIPESLLRNGQTISDPFAYARYDDYPPSAIGYDFYYSVPTNGVGIDAGAAGLLPCAPAKPDGTRGSCSVSAYWETGAFALDFSLTPEGNRLIGGFGVRGTQDRVAASSDSNGLWTFSGYNSDGWLPLGCGEFSYYTYHPCTASGYFTGPLAPTPEPAPLLIFGSALGLFSLCIRRSRHPRS